MNTSVRTCIPFKLLLGQFSFTQIQSASILHFPQAGVKVFLEIFTWMKQQYLTYHSLGWAGWVFEGKYEFYRRRHWSSHTLGFSQRVQRFLCKASEHFSPSSSGRWWANLPLDRASHLVAGPLWCGFSAAVHIICVWRFSFHNTARVWSFTYCRCYNVIIRELVMHYTFFFHKRTL